MNNNFHFSISNEVKYPLPPFHPPVGYQEFNGMFTDFDENNVVYSMIRNLFLNASLDKENIGTKYWNPFRGLVKNNQVVVIKPNLVWDERGDQIGKACMMTNASLIRPILDYLYLLQKIDGIKFKITIGDVPIQSASFDKIIDQTGLKVLVEYYKENFISSLKLLDLRHEIAIVSKTGFIAERININGDPLGYTKVHLEKSFLDEIIKDYKKFGAPDYNITNTRRKHKYVGQHYYHISNTILSSNLFINVPKIKTHKKAGMTGALKNLIGINGDKSWLPHYRIGSSKFGGDEFPDDKVFFKYLNTSARRLLKDKSELFWLFAKVINRKIIKKYFLKDYQSENEAMFIADGNWYGNDTLWRTILDLNYLLFFSNTKGEVIDYQQRNNICIGDGIISGEGNGPMDPIPLNTGLITLSKNPVIHDICCSGLMGFDWKKIPQLNNSIKLKNLFQFDGDVDKISIYGSINDNKFTNINYKDLPNLDFLPSPGWIDHIEREN
jgi:uncharacterized protein (DUF362 family)